MKEIVVGYNFSTYKVVSFQFDKENGFIWMIYPSGHKRFVDRPPCSSEDEARKVVHSVFHETYHLRDK